MALLSTGEVCTWGDRESGVSGHGDAMVEGYQFLPRVLEALAGKTAVQVKGHGANTYMPGKTAVHVKGQGANRYMPSSGVRVVQAWRGCSAA